MSILFAKDWTDAQGKPKAIVHKTTKNTSFIHMVALLQKMGIKNNLFHLCLYDPKLLHVDPHHLDATNDPEGELRLRVAVECKKNVWYYLREVLGISVSGSDPIPFRLHRGNLAMAWCFCNHIDYNGTQPRQSGKAQPLHSRIKTPDGWTLMGDIKIGDKVSAPDGTTTTVIGVHPQGVKDIYRINFEDGRSTECCDDHLWKVYNRYWSPESTQWRIITLKEIKDRLERRPNTEAGLFVPLTKPEAKADVYLPLDPYLVGALLGDGGLSTKAIHFTSMDKFIVDEVESLLPENVEVIPVGDPGQICYRFVDRSRTRVQDTSPFLNTLKSLGMMGAYSYTKSVPEMYMNASESQKLSLLQGLMDTDGTVSTKGGTTYCTTSPTLAKQVQYLVRSLGGLCKIAEKTPHYTYKGEYKRGRLAYVVHIRINNPKSLFRLPRKLDRLSPVYKSAGKLKLGVKSVEYVGRLEAQCIEVDHPDHLYITDDYIVTHNTITAIALTSWVEYISGYMMKIAMLTKDANLVQENVKRLKEMRDSLPSYLIMNSNDDTDNKQGLSYACLKNEYITYIGNKDKLAANRIGRGGTFPMIHIDETAFVPNIDITFPTIMTTTNAARVHAKRNNQPHSALYTTTAGDPTTVSGKFAFELITKAMPFTEKLYDCVDQEAAYAMVAKNSSNNLVNGTFSYLQLGYDHKWFRDTITRNSVPPDEVERDFLNNWISLAKHPIISKDVLARMTQHRKDDPLFREVMGEYIISWYVPEAIARSSSYRNKVLIMGMDSSEMIGQDFTTFVAIDPKDLSVVFTFRCNDSNTTKIGLLVAQILIEFPHLLFIPERKSTGLPIIDTAIMMLQRRQINPFARIFNKIVDQKDLEEFRTVNIHDISLADSTARKHLGFLTTGSSRPFLYKQVLQRACSMAPEKIYDPMLITELSGLQATNGRIDHASGRHDDLVIAYLLACYVVFEGKNLHHYGINPDDLLRSVEQPGHAKKDPQHVGQQIALRREIKGLEDQIKRTESDYLKKHFEYKIRQLSEYLDPHFTFEPISVDAVRKDHDPYGSYTKVAPKKAPPYSVNTLISALHF